MHSILVVDDETEVRGWIRSVLEEAGYKVSEAANGHHARWHFQKYPIDLVITDIFMPDCDGIELLQELRKAYPSKKLSSYQADTPNGISCTRRKYWVRTSFCTSHSRSAPFSMPCEDCFRIIQSRPTIRPRPQMSTRLLIPILEAGETLALYEALVSLKGR